MSSEPTNDTNIAVLYEKLDRLLLDVAGLRADFAKVTDDHEARMRLLEAGQIRLEEQQSTDNKINRALSVVAATGAAIVGSVVK